jgi:D-tyrosyl-tRNA(Tyr) deacylase
MRIVLQRVSEASVRVVDSVRVVESVRVDDEVVGAIGRGVLLLVGVVRGDTSAEVTALVRKITTLRMFPGRTPMDRTLAEVGGACLVVSQFTLAATVRKGRRPGFDGAEAPAIAEVLYREVAEALGAAGLVVATGRFGATMAVSLVGDGPVTFVLDAAAGQVL